MPKTMIKWRTWRHLQAIITMEGMDIIMEDTEATTMGMVITMAIMIMAMVTGIIIMVGMGMAMVITGMGTDITRICNGTAEDYGSNKEMIMELILK